MSNDYEWDQSGDADPAIQRLETVMGTLRYDEPLRAVVSKPVNRRQWPIAAAALVLLGAGAYWLGRTSSHTSSTIAASQSCAKAAPGSAWSVSSLGGSPLCGDSIVLDAVALEVGGYVETREDSTAEIIVADIGTVVVEPKSRVTLERTDASEHRMRLEYGKLHARVDAPPRLFLVETQAALAVDLGCEYTLEVLDSGHTQLHVLSGYVSLERDDVDIYVPAGYKSDAFVDIGPGLPYAEEASEKLRSAIQVYSRDREAGAMSAVINASSTAKDSLTLFELLKMSPDGCEAIVAGLKRITDVNVDPLSLGWGQCSAPDRLGAWRAVLQPIWDS